MNKTSIILPIIISICIGTAVAQKKADILFSHDLHSQLDNVARASTVIEAERHNNPNLFLFDGGDISMGTIYQMVYRTEAAELRTLGLVGYDVTTLGNHEFDYGSDGLHDMLESAKNSGDRLPKIVLCNADWNNSVKDALIIKQALDDYGATPYTIIEKGGVRIAVFGIFGKDALFCAPTCQVTFADPIESAKKTVAEIKAKEKADMIVCVSHSGTNKKSSKSEDELLAEKVPDIDLIVSGHSHTTLPEPITHGNTFVVSCGAYSANLGHIVLTQKGDGRWKVETYELLPITKDITPNKAVVAKLAEFSAYIDKTELVAYGLKSNEVIAQNTDTLDVHETGYVIADAMKKAIEDLEVSSENDVINGYGHPIDVTAVAHGLTRGSYEKGPLTVKEIFESYSLGIGPDKKTGYPIVSMFITGKDLKSLCELDASLSPFVNTVNLYFSGYEFTYNPHRLILDKVEYGMLKNADGSLTPIDSQKLYRIATDIYTATMMSGIESMTKGLIKRIPRDANGTPVSDFKKGIVYTKDGELKGWYAAMYALKEAGTISGYKGIRARVKLTDASWNPVKIFSHPSKFARIIYTVIILIILLIVGIISFKKSKRNKKTNK